MEQRKKSASGCSRPVGVGLQADQTGNRARALDHGNRL